MEKYIEGKLAVSASTGGYVCLGTNGKLTFLGVNSHLTKVGNEVVVHRQFDD